MNKTQDGGLGLNQFPKRGHLAVPSQMGLQFTWAMFFDGVKTSKKLSATIRVRAVYSPVFLCIRCAASRVGGFLGCHAPRWHFRDRIAFLGDLFDCFNLEFFWITFAADDTSFV